jgi:hypothetical protein
MKYFIIFLILIGFAGIAFAMPPFDSQETFDFSNTIAVGKVIYVNSTFSPTHNLYQIQVEKFFKNPQDSKIILAAGQNIASPRSGNQVFNIGDSGLFFLTNSTVGYDAYSGILGVHPTSKLVEPEWGACNIFKNDIPQEHWVFGGTGPTPKIHQENNTDIEKLIIGKQVTVTYDVFNHSLNAKNATFGIMIKNLDEPESSYVYSETNDSYLLEACVPYKTLTWAFTPSRSGHYAVEFYDNSGSHITMGFTVEQSLPFCTSDRTACFDQDGYKCDPRGWECENPIDIFSKVITSPLKQFKSGIPIEEIKCKKELNLIQKIDYSPTCVKFESLDKLIERGWAKHLFEVQIQPSQIKPEPTFTPHSEPEPHYDFDKTFTLIGKKSQYNLDYLMPSGTITDIQLDCNSLQLVLSVSSTESGVLTLLLPEEIIGNIETILVDKMQWNYISYAGNTVTVMIPENTKTIEIKGSYRDSLSDVECR